MKISDVKDFESSGVRTGKFLLVGNFYIEDEALKFNKNKALSLPEFRSNFGRVYVFTIDKEIVKIGGSSAEGGIKKTIYSYLTGDSGRPGINRFVLNRIIKEKITIQDVLIEVYMILCPETFVNINGLTTQDKIVRVFAFREIEKQCLKDYKEFENGNSPVWNFKERGVPLPQEHVNAYNKYMSAKSN